MTFTRRDRLAWRIILWVNVSAALVSACFGYAVAPFGTSRWLSALLGIVTSVMIATPIVSFELWRARPGPLRRLRRLPLAAYLAVKIVFYLVVIVVGLVLVRLLFSLLAGVPMQGIMGSSIIFSIAMTVFGLSLFEMGGLLGYSTLKSLVTGRYVQPRREEKTFLLIDMRDSTGVAERLGPIHFHALLNEFLDDIADAAVECGAEIHKYVGDEAILTWSGGAGLADGACLACPFVTRDFIAAKSRRYRERFGVVPEFRAALHCGEIVTGEIGAIRREIAYVGDTLNVAARLLDATKELGRDVLVSADLLKRATLPSDLLVEPLPMLTVRGRAAPLAISALRRSAAAG